MPICAYFHSRLLCAGCGDASTLKAMYPSLLVFHYFIVLVVLTWSGARAPVYTADMAPTIVTRVITITNIYSGFIDSMCEKLLKIRDPSHRKYIVASKNPTTYE